MIERILRLFLLITLVAQCLVHLAVPLMPHFLNDPAWYYMFKMFLFEGIWIHEDLYPSFTAPVLYYCSLGYPLLLYMAEGISSLFDCSFATVLLQIQFGCYVLSARLIYLLCRPESGRKLSLIIVLLYLWFLPFFNYAHLLMSETWFITCLLASIYCFQRGVLNQKQGWIILAFCITGYTFLVRPVAGVILPIAFVALLIHPYFKQQRIHLTLAASCFLIFPFIQSGFNQIVYHTWALREGFSWNLWNRVVNEDGYDPNRSAATFSMRNQLHEPTFLAQSGHWWDITSQLSQKGLQPAEIQRYCMQVCWDGIKADPVNYLTISLKRGLWTLPTEQQESVCIYSTVQGYSDFLNHYKSPHHQPVLDEIEKQSIGKNAFSKRMLWLYSYWNTGFLKLNSKSIYILFYGLFILMIGIEIRRFYTTRYLDPVSVVLMSVPLAMSLAACSLEVIHNRYYLPGILLQLIFLSIAWKRKVKTGN